MRRCKRRVSPLIIHHAKHGRRFIQSLFCPPVLRVRGRDTILQLVVRFEGRVKRQALSPLFLRPGFGVEAALGIFPFEFFSFCLRVVNLILLLLSALLHFLRFELASAVVDLHIVA